MNANKSIVVVFKSDGMGATDAQPLRVTLAHKFLALIADAEPLPKAICFYTDGVKLVCAGSPVLTELRTLEARGVHLVICQTCLNSLGLTENVQIGIVGGMADIITAMWGADTVITV
ncbi:MAG: DsrE family protein [Chloroflexi bacterium]|nr:DsrE family protein [Chloroflexota bacterium]